VLMKCYHYKFHYTELYLKLIHYLKLKCHTQCLLSHLQLYVQSVQALNMTPFHHAWKLISKQSMKMCSVLNDAFLHRRVEAVPCLLKQWKQSYHVTLHLLIGRLDISWSAWSPCFHQSIP